MTCPACAGVDTEVFYRRDGVPVHSCLLLDDAGEARDFPRGDLRLAICHTCGFVFNEAYDSARSRYSPDYEETQAYSAHFQGFLTELAARWVDRYGLRGGRVVEIGCGKAEFLVELVEHGVSEGIALDPGVHPERIPAHVRDRITVVQGFFPQDLADLDADAVVCRHTLEHIGPVGEFMREIRRAIGERTDTVVLFELPDTLRVLREAAFWDLYYEHCSYFTLGSLARLFRRTGFEVLDLSMAYDDQYLLIEARPITDADAVEPHPYEDDLGSTQQAVRSFQDAESALVRRWSEEVEAVSARGGRTAIWGSGSKGVAFLAALGDRSAAVGCAVDINPHKHGRFMAGTAHPIVAPAHLQQYAPELVVAMNPVYVDEIQRDLDDLGVSTNLKAL
ncbi:MAG TPA: class I SAM-dependent methyltransferase [Nocardioidaceae bacterium]|nr:class I SAM-dependent methyltransferase [Nocardioidaceae bacterium]